MKREDMNAKYSAVNKRIRPIMVDGDVAFVPLTRGQVAIIDATDVDLVAGVNWLADPDGARIYAVRSSNPENGKRRKIRMHRVIMGDPVGLDVDHINGNSLDNRRANLRLATRAENSRNAARSQRNTSGVKGVSWSHHNKKWRALIGRERKIKHLGYFQSKDDAAAAYAAASKTIHGDFGRLA